MGKQTTITLQQDAKERLEAAKPDGMSWTEFAYGVTEDGKLVESEGDVYGNTEVQEVLEQVRKLQRLVEQTPENTAERLRGEFR